MNRSRVRKIPSNAQFAKWNLTLVGAVSEFCLYQAKSEYLEIIWLY